MLSWCVQWSFKLSFFLQNSLSSVLNSKHGSRHNLPHHLSLATCRGEQLLRMIPSVCFFKNVYGIISNINSNQKLYLIDLLKLFVTFTSCRIPEHCFKRIFDCHLTRIFELFQGTIYKPIFTLIKTNTQPYLNIWKKLLPSAPW